MAYEEHMPEPNFEAAMREGFSIEVIESYRAHLFLRQHFRRVNNMFCEADEGDIL
jgi:hypothetical protein